MASTTTQPSQKLTCRPDEVTRAGCLNGGTCFAIDSGGGSRILGCSCTSEWTGDRCEYMYIDDWESTSASSQIGLAVGITLGILVLFIATVFLIFYYRSRRRSEMSVDGKQLQKNQMNGHRTANDVTRDVSLSKDTTQQTSVMSSSSNTLRCSADEGLPSSQTTTYYESMV